MNSVIEDGYNTSYLSSLFLVLFSENSCATYQLLNENYNVNKMGIYLQKLIEKKFVEHIKNNACVFSEFLNEIRNYSHVCGWLNNASIEILMSEHDPINYLNFYNSLLKYKPILLENHSENNCINFNTYEADIQKTYDKWNKSNKINNEPIYVVIKCNNLKKANNLKINKNIRLFTNNDLIWTFNGAIFKEEKSYSALIFKENGLYRFNKAIPNFTICEKKTFDKNVTNEMYLIYVKKYFI